MNRQSVRLERCVEGRRLLLEACPMGEDWNVMITGGDRPHIGAAALGVPYQRPDGRRTSGASVLVIPPHKEDVLARQAALLLARRTERTVLVSCGIHVDNLTSREIGDFMAMAEAAVEELAGRLCAFAGQEA